MKTVVLAFGIITSILVFGSINYYIGIRGWQNIGSLIPYLNNRLYWIIFWFVACSFIIAKLGEKYIPESVEHFIVIIGDYYMAAMLYLLIILPIIDLIKFAGKRFIFIPRGVKENYILTTYFGVLVLVVLIGLLVYGTWNAKNIRINQYEINVLKKAGNIKKLKIAMFSDSHLGVIVNNSRLEDMVQKINDIKPDLVLMVGDIIDEKTAPYIRENMGETMRKIRSTYGVYAVTGNHEFYGGDIDKIVKVLEEANIKVLRDACYKIDNSFYIIGREDVSSESYLKQKRKPLSELTVGIDNNLPIILLDHQPRNLKEAEKAGVDLQLSGHTHRGQMFPNQYFTKMLYEVDYGYRKKESYNIIVSSGIGTWGPPIRVGNSSELVNIIINFEEK
jgi:uncharacterized protein